MKISSEQGGVNTVCSPSPSPSREHVHIARGSRVEQHLVAVLGKLLGTSRVGVNENFFLLGGDSLLAIQVIASVRDTFGVELAPHTLFDAPTVAELSAEIDLLLLKKAQATIEDERGLILGGNKRSEKEDSL